MLDSDHWREIWHTLSSNKLRTALTAFGVFWGIFMLMVMLGAGTGLRNGVSARFEGEATNSFFLWDQRTSVPYKGLPSGRSIQMTNGDVEAIRELVPAADTIAPRNQLGGFRGGNNVTRAGKAGAFSVMGDMPQIRDVQAFDVVEGRFLNQLDMRDRRKVAVIGSRVREVLFDQDPPVGDHVRINGVYFKVVGVFASGQTGDDAEEEVNTIFVPFTTFQRAFNAGDQVGWFAITAAEGHSATEVHQQVLSVLRQRHRVSPDDNRAFGHFNLEEEFRKVQGLFAGISTLIWIVGFGTLTAGVIGVSNIMTIVVKERTREIGVRRAVGATPAAISRQVVLEALLLTAIAGGIGLIVGAGVIELIAGALPPGGAGMFKQPAISGANAALALGVLVAAGVVAGLIPAQRAILIAPVEALRAE